jgi:hypothetical protein
VAAILGTSGALALTALLAALATSFAGFTNTLGSELVSLQLPNGEGLDLRGMLLAAFMIGSIGVLDDVTVTQAAAVDELARHGLRGRRLYAGAFNVGRSHIAATVNTLFLAYAGASLPLLVFLVVGNQPAALLVNGEAISIEIVRTLVGSLGIVAAVPLTTVLAAWLAGVDEEPVVGGAAATGAAGAAGEPASLGPTRAARPRPGLALAGGLAAIAVVTAAAGAIVGPLTASGSRTPLAPDSFGSVPPVAAGSTRPGGSPGGSDGASDGPAASGDEAIFSPGDAIPLVDDNGQTTGEVTILQVDPVSATAAGGTIFAVDFQYRAVQTMTIDPSPWVARSSAGGEASPDSGATSPGRPALAVGPLGAGLSRSGWLQFTLPDTPDSLFLDYRRLGGTLFTVLVY